MAPRLSGQTSIFGVVFFVSRSLLQFEGQRKLEKFAILTRKPRSHARILIYRTWPITLLHVHIDNGRLWTCKLSKCFRTKSETVFVSRPVCVRNKFCERGQTGKHLCRQQCVRNDVSLFARAFRARIKLTSNLRDILSEIRFNKSNYKLFFLFSYSRVVVIKSLLGSWN